MVLSMASGCLNCTNVAGQLRTVLVPYVCKFGFLVDQGVPASFLDNHGTLIACTTPPNSLAGSVSVVIAQLFTSNIEMRSGHVQFEYVELRVTDVMPARGPVGGGTIVAISGIDLVSLVESSTVVTNNVKLDSFIGNFI